MTIDDPTTIDGMGFRTEDGRYLLVIYDHMEWTDEPAHLEAIMDKLNGYLTYLASGQAAEAYPDRDADAFAQPWIRISFAHEPTEAAVHVLGNFAAQLQPVGVTMSYEAGEPMVETILSGGA